MNDIDNLVKNYIYPKELASYLSTLLKRSYNINSELYNGLSTESSFLECLLMNSIITHCMNYGYSVFRGQNQRFVLNNVKITSDFDLKKFDLVTSFNDFNLYSENNYLLNTGDELEFLTFIVADKINQRSFQVSPNIPYLYIIDDVVSDDVIVTLNDKIINPLIITLPDFGILICNYDESTKSSVFESGKLTVTYVKSKLEDIEVKDYVIPGIEYETIYNKPVKLPDYDKLINIYKTQLKYTSKNFIFSNNDIKYLILSYFKNLAAVNIDLSVLTNVPWFTVNIPVSNGGNLRIYNVDAVGGYFDTNNNCITKLYDNEYKVTSNQNSLEIIDSTLINNALFKYYFKDLIKFESDDVIAYTDGNSIYESDSKLSLIINDKIQAKNLAKKLVYNGTYDLTTTSGSTTTTTTKNYSIVANPTKIDNQSYDFMVDHEENYDTVTYFDGTNSYIFNVTNEGVMKYKIVGYEYIGSKKLSFELNSTIGKYEFLIYINDTLTATYNITGFDTPNENIVNQTLYNSINLKSEGINLINTFSNRLNIYYESVDSSGGVVLNYILNYSNNVFKLSLGSFILNYEVNYNNISISKDKFKYSINNNGIFVNYFSDNFELPDISSITCNTLNNTFIYDFDTEVSYSKSGNYLSYYNSVYSKIATLSKTTFNYRSGIKTGDWTYNYYNDILVTGDINGSKVNLVTTNRVVPEIAIPLSYNNNLLSIPFIDHIENTIPYDSNVTKTDINLELLFTLSNLESSINSVKYQYYDESNEYSKAMSYINRTRLMKVLCIYNSKTPITISDASEFNRLYKSIMYDKLNCYFVFCPAEKVKYDLNITVYYEGEKSLAINKVEEVLVSYENKIGETFNPYKIISDINGIDIVNNVSEVTELQNQTILYYQTISINRESITYERVES